MVKPSLCCCYFCCRILAQIDCRVLCSATDTFEENLTVAEAITFDVKTGSGRITVDGRQEGDWKIDSGSGSIRVRLPDDAAFQLDAESNSGGINVE